MTTVVLAGAFNEAQSDIHVTSGNDDVVDRQDVARWVKNGDVIAWDDPIYRGYRAVVMGASRSFVGAVDNSEGSFSIPVPWDWNGVFIPSICNTGEATVGSSEVVEIRFRPLDNGDYVVTGFNDDARPIFYVLSGGNIQRYDKSYNSSGMPVFDYNSNSRVESSFESCAKVSHAGIRLCSDIQYNSASDTAFVSCAIGATADLTDEQRNIVNAFFASAQALTPPLE